MTTRRQVLRWGRSAYETDEALAMERDGIEALGARWEFRPGPTPPQALAEADVLVVNSGVRVERAVVEALRGTRILTTTSGYDHVDLEACRRRGVALARLPLARRDAVVEHTLACLVWLHRRLPELVGRARAGRWARAELPELAPRVVRDLPILVVGLGVIGARVAEVLGILGAQVLGVDPAGVPAGVEEVELDQGLARARAITLHCSLTSSSRGLLSANRLATLHPGSVVVNTARGRVLDVNAAVEQLCSGRLRGLAVDVFPVEPYPGLARSASHPALLFTPHGAGYSHDLGDRVAAQVCEAVGAWLGGAEPPFGVV